MKLSRPFLVSALGATVFLLASPTIADGRDSLLHWWKVNDANGDGLLQAGEFYDIMTKSASSPKTGTTVYQATDGVDAKDLVTVETISVYKPTARKYVTDQVVHLHNPTNWVNGVLKCNYQAVEAANACIGRQLVNNKKEGTVFVRFKWDGRRFKKYNSPDYNYSYDVTLYSDAYNSYSGWGWKVGFRVYDSGTANKMYPSFTYGNAEYGFYQNPHDSSFLVNSGLWYEMAVTFRHEKIDGVNYLTRAVLLRRGDPTEADYGHREYYYDKRSSTFTPGWAEFAVDGHRISLGYRSYSGASGGTTFENATGSGDSSFIGVIHEVKEYTKYMDEYELLQTMVDSDPECMVGSKNGKATEFSDTDAAEVYEPTTMDWIKMRKTLTAATPLAVKVNLEENGHQLARLVEMKFLKSTAFAGERVKIALNGSRFGSKLIPANGEVRFFLSADRLASVAKDAATGTYPVTLTLTRGDTLGTSVTLDYFTVGGAWQLGAIDNSSKGFGDSSYYNTRYCVGQRNISKMCGSIGNYGLYKPLRVHFGLTDWAAANVPYRLTVKSVNGLNTPMYLTVSGTDEKWTLSGLSAYYNGGTNILFSAGILPSGSRLQFTCDDSGTSAPTVWDEIDYLRLEPIRPKGFRNTDEGFVWLLK